MNFISSRMKGGNLDQITVFNPLSWNRSEWISVKVALPANINNFTIQQGEKQVPFEILSSYKQADSKKTNIWLSVKVDIPALTFQSFSIVAAKTIHNPAKTIDLLQRSFLCQFSNIFCLQHLLFVAECCAINHRKPNITQCTKVLLK